VVKVEIQTTDMVEIRSSPALIDSSTTGLFMDWRYVECYKLTTRKLHFPILVYNVNGFPNEAGSITEAVEVILHLNRHAEHVNFAVTNLGKQNLILGFTWLQEHNPKINWKTQKITISCCPDRCHTCQTEVQEEQKTLQKEERRIRACRAGPLLRFTEEDLSLGKECRAWEVICDAELSISEDIRASQTTSQRLTKENYRQAPTDTEVPEYLQDFRDVFAKESFNVLPNRKV